MKKVLLIFIALILLSSLVFAYEEDKLDYSKYLDNLQDVKNYLNQNMDKVPGFAKKFLGDNNINIHFTSDDGSKFNIYAVIKDNNIKTLEKGSLDGADIDVYLKESDIHDIINSDNPRKEAKNKLDNGNIKYKANGFFKNLKFKIIKKFL